MYYKEIYSYISKRDSFEIDDSLDMEGLPYEKVSFKSKKDGLTLRGLFFPAKFPSNKTLILVHGLKQNKLLSGYTEKLSRYLAPEGYNIFAIDLRCHGESDGRLTTFGCCEKYDVMGAIDYLKQRGREGEKIALLGFSMGAVSAIEAAGKDERVDALIADSPFRDLRLYISRDLTAASPSNLSFLPKSITQYSHWPLLFRFLLKDKILRMIARVCSINLEEASPMNTAKEFSCKPVFIIHSRNDKLIPYTNSEAVYESLRCNPNASLWITEKAEHMESLYMYPQEYLSNIKAFLDKSL